MNKQDACHRLSGQSLTVSGSSTVFRRRIRDLASQFRTLFRKLSGGRGSAAAGVGRGCYHQAHDYQRAVRPFPRDSFGAPRRADVGRVRHHFRRLARPGNCSTGHDPGNHFYLQLIGPIAYFGYGLATRERVIEDMRRLLDTHTADPEGFAASLLPDDTVGVEVSGPDCG